MSKSFVRDIPTGAAITIVALVLLASIVTGRENREAPAIVEPVDKRIPAAPIEIEDLDLKRLPVRERSHRSIQDLFASPAPPAAPPAPVPAAVVAAAPPLPPAPSAPPLPFSYLGQMRNGERTIVYLLKNQTMLLAEKGQTVETDYQVESISDSEVRLTYLPLGTKQVLAVPPRPQ